ncbi:MAG: hypothetical protein JNJ83_23650 [Verrucomicrobiaceae bacterium]|nr:hypothetical protein [Verrucomicrobiaceae bacterium]
MNPSTPKNTSSSDAPGFLGRRPWLLVIAAFALLFAAWTTLFVLAYKHQPEVIQITH